MNLNERLDMVAPCGIDCGICELNLCDENSELHSGLISRGIPKEKIPCKGCRAINGDCPVIPRICDTYTCITEKGLDFCFDCDDFPCIKLHPSSDRADVLPHNLKVFNLCKIQNTNLQEFVEVSGEIKQRYYKGKMFVGKGPQM
jgi:hypothetical protein